jgi:hypothetical protein
MEMGVDESGNGRRSGAADDARARRAIREQLVRLTDRGDAAALDGDRGCGRADRPRENDEVGARG